MAIVRMMTLMCDQCYTNADNSEWSAAEAIRKGKLDGWHVRGRVAICEYCWNKGTRFAARTMAGAR